LLNIQEKGAEFDRLISIINKITSLEEAYLLDVGCNTGTFLNQVQRYTSNIFGIEPSEEAALYSIKKGYKVQNVVIEKMDYPDNFFNVITLWDVIEHLYNPPSDLDILFKKLRPGGNIFISTHNIDSWLARLTGKSYPMLMYQHFFHFSAKTLGTMLSNAGFTGIKVVPFCKSWSIRYLYQLFNKIWPNSLITKFSQFCLKPLVANEKIASIRVIIPIRNFFVISAEKSK
jgi:SAM-dependent methyltransferase